MDKLIHAYNITRDVGRTATSTKTHDIIVNDLGAMNSVLGAFGRNNIVTDTTTTTLTAVANLYNHNFDNDGGTISDKLALVESIGQIMALSPYPQLKAIGTAISIGAGTASIIAGRLGSNSSNPNNSYPPLQGHDNISSSGDSSSNSTSSDANNGNNSSEPPPPPLTPIFQIKLPNGDVVYTDSPLKPEYRGGELSLAGFKEHVLPFYDPIPLDDWQVNAEEAKNSWGNNAHGKNRGYQIVDPVVLDLDGDGIETLAHAKNKGAMFDFDGDGLKNATGWVKSDDRILVFDRNGDGFNAVNDNLWHLVS